MQKPKNLKIEILLYILQTRNIKFALFLQNFTETLEICSLLLDSDRVVVYQTFTTFMFTNFDVIFMIRSFLVCILHKVRS